MSLYKRRRDESVENEPLDLTNRIIKSPVSILYGLKKSRTTVWDEEAVKSAWKKKRIVVDKNPGVKYPIDVWFLIADHIDPENVGKFASICKDTLFVTDTAVFWSRMYKRCYVPGIYLTASLRPNTLKERFGLRTRVIRALHLMHKPLAIKREMSLKKPIMRNRLVMRQWHESNKPRGQWTYYFELRDICYKRRWVPNTFEEYRNDIALNPAEGCIMLKTICTQRLQLPLLVGFVLKDVEIVPLQSKTITMKCLFHYKKEKKVHTLTVEIGPIISSHVVNWWSPRYPHLIPVPYGE